MMVQASDGNGQRPGYLDAVGSESLEPDFNAEIRKRIGRGLKDECQRAVSEPLPARLLQLLGDLERVAPDPEDEAADDDPYRQPDA